MKEELIGFEVAKLAKQKGFNITNKNSYDENTGLMLPLDPHGHCYALGGVCPAPTQSLLQKWLREKHKLSVLCHVWNGVLAHYCIIALIPGEENIRTAIYDTYEESLEEGLFRALKLI